MPFNGIGPIAHHYDTGTLSTAGADALGLCAHGRVSRR